MAKETMSAKKALDYLVGLHNCFKHSLSEDMKKHLKEGGKDPFESINRCKALIEDRLYMMENDESDYAKLESMELVLKNHFQIFTMLENGILKNNSLLEINVYNK